MPTKRQVPALKLGGYTSLIIESTGCAHVDAAEIEEIMRQDIFHSTLDWLTLRQFIHGAKQAAALLPEILALKARIAAEVTS